MPQLVNGGNGAEAEVCDSEAGSPPSLHSVLLLRGLAPAPRLRCVPQGTEVGQTVPGCQWTSTFTPSPRPILGPLLLFSHPVPCSTPGLPVPHHLLEFAQVHVHYIGEAVPPSSSWGAQGLQILFLRTEREVVLHIPRVHPGQD